MKLAERKNLWLGTAACLVLVSILLLLTKGLNFGIDFTGGTLLERRLPVATNGTEIMEQLSRLSDLGGDQMARDNVPSSVQRPWIVLRSICGCEAEAYGDGGRRTEMVGPVIGGELIRGLWSLGLRHFNADFVACFEWTFGVAVLPWHNVLVVCSFCWAWRSHELYRAILTMVGRVMTRDLDRIRENRRNQPKLDQIRW